MHYAGQLVSSTSKGLRQFTGNKRLDLKEGGWICPIISLVTDQAERILMDQLVGACRMAGLSIRVAGTHFLADQWTALSLELLLELSVEETENRKVIPIIVSVIVVNVTIVHR